MGGVDQCIDIAVTNAYILHRASLPVSQRTKHDHKFFIRQLVRELLEASFAAVSMSSPMGRPPRSSVRAQHRLMQKEVLCYVQKSEGVEADRQAMCNMQGFSLLH